MRAVLHAMPAFMRASLATMLQYRGEIVLWAVWGVVYPAVAMAMWSAAVRGSPTGGAIGGYTPPEFAAYFLLTMVVGHLSTAWDIYEMGYMVQSGTMSPLLLRPILPIWNNVANNIAYKSLTLVLLLPVWGLVALVSHPSFAGTSAIHLLLGIPAALLAAALHFVWGYNISLLAFRFTRMDAVSELWWGANLFFGGRVAPLTILPLPLQWAADVLPFKWIIWFPAAALMGKLDVSAILLGLGAQIFWLGAALLVFRLGWSAAVKRYTAVGA